MDSENHGPFGQISIIPNGTWFYGPSKGGPGAAGACAGEQAGTERIERTRGGETLWRRASAWGG